MMMQLGNFLTGFYQQASQRRLQNDPLTPPLMPDEEMLRKTRRRAFQRKRRTGRDSTILTDRLG